MEHLAISRGRSKANLHPTHPMLSPSHSQIFRHPHASLHLSLFLSFSFLPFFLHPTYQFCIHVLNHQTKVSLTSRQVKKACLSTSKSLPKTPRFKSSQADCLPLKFKWIALGQRLRRGCGEREGVLVERGFSPHTLSLSSLFLIYPTRGITMGVVGGVLWRG